MKLRNAVRPIFPIMALGLLALPAYADTFDFSYDFISYNAGPDRQNLEASASGVLTTTNTEVDGALLITGIAGSRTTNWYTNVFLNPPQTNTITSLLPPGTPIPEQPITNWDNLLYPNSSSLLDGHGFAFMLNCVDCGSYQGGVVQVAGFDGTYFELGTASQLGGNFTLTPVPEPNTFLILALALPAVLFCIIPRKPKSPTN